MLNIVSFKGCKRCGGDLFLEYDYDAVYLTCLQCGASLIGRDKEEEENIKEVLACSDTIRHHE